MKNLKIIQLILLSLVLVSGYLFYFGRNLDNDNLIKINQSFLKAEVALTPEERRTGLSNRESISFDEALIFIFDETDHQAVWMKDMNFSIDVIWIDEDRVIVDYIENLSPETYPEIFISSSPVRYMIEVSAGFIKENNIKVGDKVDF